VVIKPAIGKQALRGLQVQDHGQILVSSTNLIARYLVDGTPDPLFNKTGVISTTLGDCDLALQSDGRIVASAGGASACSARRSPFRFERCRPTRSISPGDTT
jgi:hypothetical protein